MKNLLILSGRTTRDFEIKYFESGKCKSNSAIAVDGYYNKEKVTSFFNIEIWDKKAEFVAEHVKKGTSVIAVGELTKSDYKDKEGNNKTAYTVKCRDISFSGNKIVINAFIDKIDEHTVKLTYGEETIIATTFMKNIPEVKLETCILNIRMENNKPVYTLESVI